MYILDKKPNGDKWMSSYKKRYNPLKASSIYLSEEAQTPAEKIMDEILPSLPIITEDNFKETSPIIQHIEQTQTTENAQTAEKELLDLLDKYYNGERDVAKELRYKNKEQYKQLLIQKFKQWGLLYVEKKHYALSRPEKHLIRIDFYGTVNKPRSDQKSEAYTQNSTFFVEELSRKEKKKAKNSAGNNTVPTFSSSSQKKPKYSPQDYDLNTSPTWRLMRTFPRFHTIENKVRIQMAKQGINPQILPLLNIYDYSDILYNYYQKPETQEGDSVRIFLGARQAFIKDLFRKHADWFRDYFKRHNYNERYTEALIKAAQRKGITTNIGIKTTLPEFIYEYLWNNKQNFISFIQTQINIDNHTNNILQKLTNTTSPLSTEMRNFILEHEQEFINYLKRKYIISQHLDATFTLLENDTPPLYLKESLKNFVLSNPKKFQEYLYTQNISQRESELILEKLKNKQTKGKIDIFISEFATQNLKQLENYLHAERRDENYIKYIINNLKQPLIPEYLREGMQNFILTQNKDTDLCQELQSQGITQANYPKIKSYILQHRKEYCEFFKQNNILTYQELNEQYTDITNFIIKTQNIPKYIENFSKHFILRNHTVFRYWYSNFRLNHYQQEAENKHKNILSQGLSENDFSEVSNFIKERLEIFSKFCQDKELALTPQEILFLFNQGNFFKPQEANKFTNKDIISTMKNLLEQFIRRNGYIYRNSLIQQHIKAKENEADNILTKMAQQRINASQRAIVHKFILNNKPLFNDNLYNSDEAQKYSEAIKTNLTQDIPSKNSQKLAKEFILHHKTDFITFMNTPQNIKNYIQETLKQLENPTLQEDISYWGLQYIFQDKENFFRYLETEKISQNQIITLQKQLKTLPLAQILKINFNQNNLPSKINDDFIKKATISTHHINAVQDSFEQYYPDNETPSQNISTSTFDPKQQQHSYIPHLAAANYFENLCGTIDDPYHIRFLHGMDKTEKFDNWERYIGRIYPENKHIVFFGGLDPQDQLTYDYSQDERTKRYRKHTEKMIALASEQRKNDTLSPETKFYIVTGSRQGRY